MPAVCDWTQKPIREETVQPMKNLVDENFNLPTDQGNSEQSSETEISSFFCLSMEPQDWKWVRKYRLLHVVPCKKKHSTHQCILFNVCWTLLPVLRNKKQFKQLFPISQSKRKFQHPIWRCCCSLTQCISSPLLAYSRYVSFILPSNQANDDILAARHPP